MTQRKFFPVPKLKQPEHTQTVEFEVRLTYLNFERPYHWDASRTLKFKVLEQMLDFVRKEARRQDVKLRATTGEYRMVLTDHGKDVCANDSYRATSHKDAINGTWFKLKSRHGLRCC